MTITIDLQEYITLLENKIYLIRGGSKGSNEDLAELQIRLANCKMALKMNICFDVELGKQIKA